MRNDVVNDCSLDVASFLLTLHAKRMLVKINFARLAPLSRVSAGRCGALHRWVQAFMLCAVLFTISYKPCATGMAARLTGFVGHKKSSLGISRLRQLFELVTENWTNAQMRLNLGVT